MSLKQQRMKKRKRTNGQSPVFQVRRVSELTRLLLFVRAGGRCEFDGCLRYLMEHPVTLTVGNFAQVAHIVAFRVDGPRGRSRRRPRNIHSAQNLMLLCPMCHKLIDDNPRDYTRRTLTEYKRRHEKWMKEATGLSPKLRTALIVFKAPIGKHAVSVPYEHMAEAVAPRYPISREGLEIDLTNLLEENPAVTTVAQENVAKRLARYFEPDGEWQRAGHISVFAIAPMALLIFFGSQLTNKVPVDLFQRHRDTENWKWKESGPPVKYKFQRVRTGSDPEKVALLLCLSGSGPRENLPAEIDSVYFVYELTLERRTPSPTFLARRTDLGNFRTAYQNALSEIAHVHGKLKTLDLFPAVPAPVAVLCGRETLPKVHPALRVYDYDKARNGFLYQLTINN